MADSLRFTAVYEQAEDGWVYAHVPELPEVHTQGKDLDEARAIVEDAIQLVTTDPPDSRLARLSERFDVDD